MVVTSSILNSDQLAGSRYPEGTMAYNYTGTRGFHVESPTPLPDLVWNVTSMAAGNTSDATEAYQFYRIEQVTFLCILFTFIVFGNTSVLVAILLSKARKSRMNFFIMHLAIADLTTGLMTVLTDILWKVTVEWYAGNVGCKLIRYMQSVPTFASTYVLVGLSVDRLDAIAWPMHFTRSAQRAKVFVIVAWFLALVFSLPMGILVREKLHKGMVQCHMTMSGSSWKVYVTMLAFLLFFVPAIIITACYTVIVKVIWSKGATPVGTSAKIAIRRVFTKRNGTENSNHATPHGQGNPRCPSPQPPVAMESHTSSRGVIPKARIKTVKMTFVIVIAFIVCWSPYFIFDLMDVYGAIPMSQRKIAIGIFINSLSTLNSAANPLIYCLFSTRICSNWRRFRVCDWLASSLFGSCAAPEPKTVRGVSYNSTKEPTDYYTSMDPDARGRLVAGNSPRVTAHARHSPTPYVKVTLTEHDNMILLKHIRSQIDQMHYIDSEPESGGEG